MDEEQLAKLLAGVKSITDALATDMSEKFSAMDSQYKALADSVAKIKADAAGERDRGVDGTMAVRVAADAVDPAAFAAVAKTVFDMKKQEMGRQADLNAYADVQSKADSVMRALGSAAEPSMRGEDLVSYKIRLHRKMQKHSSKWKGVDLQLIAADHVALDNVLAEVRADAMQAAMSPVGMPEFQHRQITKTMPGGHTLTEWIGNGTFIKQLSRPVRQVAYIGVRK